MGNPFMQTMMQSTDVLHSDNKHSAYETIAHYLWSITAKSILLYKFSLYIISIIF